MSTLPVRPHGISRLPSGLYLLLALGSGFYFARSLFTPQTLPVTLLNGAGLVASLPATWFACHWFARRFAVVLPARFLTRCKLVLLWLTLPALLTLLFPLSLPRYVLRFSFFVITLLLGAGLSTTRAGDILRRLISSRAGRSAELFYFNLIFLLLLVEGMLRFVGAFHPSPLFSPPNLKAETQIRNHLLKPNQLHLGYRVNSLGFCDQEFSPGKKPGVFRLLGLTDSFGVETVPHPDNFLTLLESPPLIQGTSVEVYNLGVDAISPAGYLHLARRYFTSLNSDLALVCLFVGNDITGLPKKQPSMAILRREAWYSWFVPARLFTLLAEKSRQQPPPSHEGLAPSSSKEPGREDGRGGEEPTFSRESFLRIEEERLAVTLEEGRDSVLDRQFNELSLLLDEIKEITAGRILVLIIPDEFQVNDSLWQELITRIPEGERLWYQRTRPNERIQQICSKLRIPLLDLLPPLNESGQSVYHLQDTHWNAEGHRRVAEAIRHELQERMGQMLQERPSSGNPARGAE